MRLRIKLSGGLAAACECVSLVFARVSRAFGNWSPRASARDVEKVRLAQERDFTGPYTGEWLWMNDLFGEPPKGGRGA